MRRMFRRILIYALLVSLLLAALPASAAVTVRLNKTKATLYGGRTLQLIAAIIPVPEAGSDSLITWTSKNPSVATVDDKGLVTAGTKQGVAVIQARTPGGAAAACRVTVKVVKVTGVTLTKAKATLKKGEQLTLSAKIRPSNATIQTIAWRSGNEGVAAVKDGVVTAVGPGVAKITASAGAKSAQCVITVPSEGGTPVTITATGDITIGGDPRKPASSPASLAYYEALYARNNGNFLKDVKSLFKGDNEITLINLESCLYDKDTPFKQNKAYVLRGKSAYASILSEAGVDVVGHANNHSVDFMDAGITQTRRAVTEHGMKYAGNGVLARVTRSGVKVGFCAFSALYITSSVTNGAKNAIRQLKKDCDIVVISFHWGTEYVYTASAAQRNLGRAAINAGADLVVGHHSHVVGGIEKYKGKYIVYSLGTLSSALRTPEDMDTFIYKQTFEVDPVTGAVSEGTVKLIPCSMSSQKNINDAMPTRLGSAGAERVLNKKIKRYSPAQTLPDSAWK